MPRPRAPTPELALYRVFPWIAAAPPGDRGHPLHVSVPQGAGRVDNPAHYRVLYASDSPAGAVAEAFGNHAAWTSGLLRGRPDMPGSVTALAAYRARIEILDLDDARALLQRRLRPSQVVTRDRTVTQRWALEAFREGKWAGVRWWSYHDPRWGSYGLWSRDGLEVTGTEALRRDHPAVVQAAAVLSRPFG
jgi:hypothetical protein